MSRICTLLTSTALALAGTPALATYIPTGNGVSTLQNTTGAPVVVELDANSRPLLVPASSFGSGSTATTLSSAVLDSTGTKLTLTFSQADTLTLADFSVSVAGTAASLTDADAATSGTTHVLTLATAATYQQAVTLSATPVAATSPALGAVISGATVTNNSTVGAPAATTLSSAVVASNGTSLTLTFNQAVTLIAADFSVSVAGSADSFTDSDASTSQTTHVLTLATAAASGQAVTVSASPVGATTPPLGATFSGTAATNNSTVAAPTGGQTINFTGPAGAPTGLQALTAFSNNSPASVALDGNGNLVFPGSAYNQGGLFAAAGVQGDGTLTLTKAASKNDFTLYFRASSSSSTWYDFHFRVATDGIIQFEKTVNGSYTSIQSVSNAQTISNVVLTISGSTFTLSANGVSVASFTDTSIGAGGYVGLVENDQSVLSVSQLVMP